MSSNQLSHPSSSRGATVVKKRKSGTLGELPKQHHAKQRKPPVEISPDVELLQRILAKTDEVTLRGTLVASLSTASPSEVNALKSLLGPLVSAVLNPLHCVRCHKSYTEQENNWRSCEIEHMEPGGDSESSGYGDEDSESDHYDSYENYHEMLKYPCCGERIREDRADGRRDPCVSTKHTTNPKSVEYYVGDQVVPPKKTGYLNLNRHWDKYRGQNEYVVTCEQKGCA